MQQFASLRSLCGITLTVLVFALPAAAQSPSGYTVLDLGALGGVSSFSLGLNASGQVAGAYDNTGNAVDHAVRWTGTTAQDLGTLGGKNSYGYGINASGQIAGKSQTTGSTNYHAVLWTGIAPTDLGTLGGKNSYATSINTFGDIVGYSDWTGSGEHAFLYTSGRITDLNSLLATGSNWQLNDARGINDRGWITGVGTINGVHHAYLLLPNVHTLTGRIALEGVPDLSHTSPAAPLGTFHISFRAPGTTTEVYGADVTLTTTPGSAFGTYTLTGVPDSTYDMAIKGDKSLRVVLPNVTVSTTALPDMTLPAGDANGDNSVDIADFGVLVNAYGGDSAISGSGYDPSCDFNYDGKVDIGDFGLLVNDFSETGDP